MNKSHRPYIIYYGNLFLLLSTLLSGSVYSNTAVPTIKLAPFEIDYDISRSGITIVHMKRQLLKINDNEYRFESRSRPSKAVSWILKDRISEHSHWKYHQQQPRPLHYHYQRRDSRKKKHIELDFDWQKGIVSDNKRAPFWSSRIPPQTLDKLLYQLQLMLDLQSGKAELSYTIADSGKIRHYDFVRTGTETIQLPLGRYETVKLHRNSGERSSTIWFAPELNYLPVRIEHQAKDGSIMQANATRVKGLPFHINNESQP